MDNLKKAISWIITKGTIKTADYELKPFDCPLCASWWACIIYLVASGQFTIVGIFLSAIMAIAAKHIKNIIYYIDEKLTKLLK